MVSEGWLFKVAGPAFLRNEPVFVEASKAARHEHVLYFSTNETFTACSSAGRQATYII
jgi:hypothetical protein